MKILREDGSEFLGRCMATESSFDRMRGLLGRTSLAAGEGLWLSPCTSIHMFFMRMPIDAAFLNRAGRIIALYENFRPWRHSWIHVTAAGVLEAGAGSFARAGIKKGEVLRVCHST